MYLIGKQVTINWELLPHPNTVPLDALDLVITRPDKSSTYIPYAIQSADFKAPTETENGFVKYKITPFKKGMWKVSLVIGTEDNYQILSEVDMQVFGNQVSTQEYRINLDGNLKPVEWQLIGWNNVVGEYGPFVWDATNNNWYAEREVRSEGLFTPLGVWNIGYRETSIPVSVSVVGSDTVDNLHTISITDTNDNTIGSLQEENFFSRVGYTLSETVLLNFSAAGDIQNLVLIGSYTEIITLDTGVNDFYSSNLFPLGLKENVEAQVQPDENMAIRLPVDYTNIIEIETLNAYMSALESDFVFDSFYIPVDTVLGPLEEQVTLSAVMSAVNTDFVFNSFYIPVDIVRTVKEEVLVNSQMSAEAADFVFNSFYIPIDIILAPLTDTAILSSQMTAASSDFVFTEEA